MTKSSPSTQYKYVWKIENFSSLSSTRHYSEVFYACGVKWALSIDPKGPHATYKSPAGGVVTWKNGTGFIIGLYPYGTESRYVEYRLSVINLKDTTKTRKYDNVREMHGKCPAFCEAMRLTELLDPKKGFIINDTCYIKVKIICAMKMLKAYQRKQIQALTCSLETETQSAGDSKSASNENPGENQNTETKDEERKLSLSRWFQKRIKIFGRS